MERILVTVFDDEARALAGERALLELDSEGSISLYGYAVITKDADGGALVRRDAEGPPLRTFAGTGLGGVLGLVGGPAGLAVGATAGLAAGALLDAFHAMLGDDFTQDVTRTLQPGKSAVAAVIDEDWTAPVDTRMEAIGGTVRRRAIADTVEAVHREHVAALKADLVQLKAERAMSHAERRKKLDQRIDRLEDGLRNRIQQAKGRRRVAEEEAQARANRLQEKADAMASRKPSAGTATE